MKQKREKPRAGRGRKRRAGPGAVFGVLSVLFAAGFSVLCARETDVLIARGAAFYRSAQIVLAAAFALCLAAGTAAFLLERKARRKALEAEAAAQEEARRREAVLSSENGRLEEETIGGLLASLQARAEGAHNGGMLEVVLSYRQQMDQMNRCQAKLHHLLTMNGMTDLEETERLLDEVEQSMFRNLRKAINWMEMAGPAAPLSPRLSEQLEGVMRDNDDILSRSGELLTSLTDYVNHQGRDGSAADTIGIVVESLRTQMKEDER